jgi:chloramphenicol-sensitive protein RarD
MSSRFAIPEGAAQAERRLGLLNGFGAYALWGLLPLYFKLFPHAGAVEVVAHRIVWSVAFLAVVLLAMRQYPQLTAALGQRRIMAALTLSALLIAVNWLVFIWAIGAHHVLAASLGYFLNPIVNVLIGTLFLRERLTRGQKIAVGVAAVGVAVLAAGEIQTLWISLTLAISFAFYGLVRKLTPVPAAVGLAVETLVLFPAALGSLIWFGMAGTLAFGREPLETAFLAGLGVVTAIPLLLFAGAARRLSMVTLGLIQYVAPSFQFAMSIFLFGEPLSAVRLASFALIWVALALFVRESLAARARS